MESELLTKEFVLLPSVDAFIPVVTASSRNCWKIEASFSDYETYPTIKLLLLSEV